ncbi:hypothetical protein BaRGS_00039415, partial [Batillaria attramentaria]
MLLSQLSTVASRHRLQHVSPGTIPFVTGEARLSSSPKATQHGEGEGATERDRDNTEGQGARAYAPKSVRMLNYNIEGLMAKISEADFIEYVNTFDIVCLTETFLVHDRRLDCFSDFEQYFSPAFKFTVHDNKCSGGVLVMVKSKHSHLVQRIDTLADNIVVLKIDKTVFGFEKDVIFCGAYVPPSSSPYYKQAHVTVTCSVSLVEQCVLDCMQTFGQSCVYLLAGDFNARTG